MKKLFYLFLIVGIAVVSCNKPADLQTASEQEVTITASAAELGFKSTSTTSNCDVIPTQAKVTIKDATGTELPEIIVNIFMVNGVFVTQTFSLPVGDYTIEEFMLVDANTNPSLIYLVPKFGAQYASLVTDALPINLTVSAFQKNELSIEVLCFNADDYELYGYTWFALNITELNSFCFFGDLCIPEGEIDIYAGNTFYSQQKAAGSHDIPAIFEIRVYDAQNSTELETYSNIDLFGETAPLCVDFPTDGKVYFQLFVYVYDNASESFSYELYHTWYVENSELHNAADDSLVNIGTDGFLDFAIGSCVLNPDLRLDW